MSKCKHEFKSVDSANLYIGNELVLIHSCQCVHCERWYFFRNDTKKRVNLRGGYKGEEVEDEFE